ncbi:MAG: hypothetical protein U5L02_19465 [Rheinheimera sp.]|nr:hypothetical protein [Rheinheimera sp.]
MVTCSNQTTLPQISVGPNLYYWPKAQLEQFYQHIAQSPATVIYLGETVCSKRFRIQLCRLSAYSFTLQEVGKQVVLSGLTLLKSQADLRALQQLTAQGQFMVEANDVGTAHYLFRQQLPLSEGAALSLY